jgi:hypothetical protein
MRKAWMAAASGLVALTTTGCVFVVGDDDHNLKMGRHMRSVDGYVMLDRDGSYSRLGGDFNLRGRLGGNLNLVSGDVDADALEVGGDVSLAAGDVNFSGHVGGEASVAAGDVDWNADVDEDLSIAAGDLDVSGRIMGKASLAAGEMSLTADFMDGLDAAADEIYLAGSVSGNLELSAGNEIRRNRRHDNSRGLIELSGNISNGGEICARTVIFKSAANVTGTLTVWSESEPQVESGARTGNLVYVPRDGRDCDDLLDD